MYCDRKWLNSPDSASTGSIVAYHGPAPWDNRQGERETMTILELADCHGKVRLHKAEYDSMDEFIAKLELIKGTVESFIAVLTKQAEGGEG